MVPPRSKMPGPEAWHMCQRAVPQGPEARYCAKTGPADVSLWRMTFVALPVIYYARTLRVNALRTSQDLSACKMQHLRIRHGTRV